MATTSTEPFAHRQVRGLIDCWCVSCSWYLSRVCLERDRKSKGTRDECSVGAGHYLTASASVHFTPAALQVCSSLVYPMGEQSRWAWACVYKMMHACEGVRQTESNAMQ